MTYELNINAYRRNDILVGDKYDFTRTAVLVLTSLG